MSEWFGRNLKYLREKKDIDQLELAGLLGRKSASSISEWEKGTYTPKSGVLSDIARIFNVNLQDLMNSDLSASKPSNLIYASPATVRVPVLGSISCGDPLLVEENIKEYRYESPDMLPSGDCYYLEANGDSMEPAIPNGSLVLIRFQPEVESGEIAAVLLNGNEEATLKRVRKQGGNIILYPDNSNYNPIFVDAEHPAKIIGKAVSVKYNL